MTLFYNLLFTLFLFDGVYKSTAATRYACLRPRFPGGHLGNNVLMSMSDDDSLEDMARNAAVSSMMTGHLSCNDMPNTLILVTKAIHGDGGHLSSCASPNEYCDHVEFAKSDVGNSCDRRSRCMPNIGTKFLPQCGVSSNFVHVEYECVDPWSVFEICHESQTLYRGSKVFITSPSQGMPPTASCECILKERQGGQLRMDYTHSNMDQATCPQNYILFETKSGNNQTGIDSKDNICGRQTVRNKMYKGSLRLTYGTRTRFHTDGFLTKMAIKESPDAMISVQCGPVLIQTPGQETAAGSPAPNRGYAPPDYYQPTPPSTYNRQNVTYNQPPPYMEPPYSNSPWTGPWSGPPIPPPFWDNNPYYDPIYGPPPMRSPPPPPAYNTSSNYTGGPGPQRPPPMPYDPYAPMNPPYWDIYRPRPRLRTLDLFSSFGRPPPPGRWPQNRDQYPVSVDQGPRNKEEALDPFDDGNSILGNNSKPTALPSKVELIGKSARFEGTPVTRIRHPRKPVVVTNPPVETNVIDNKKTREQKKIEQEVAYIVGGTGAIMCAVSIIIIIIYCSRRRSKKLKETDSEQYIYSVTSGKSFDFPNQKGDHSYHRKLPQPQHSASAGVNLEDFSEDDQYTSVVEISARRLNDVMSCQNRQDPDEVEEERDKQGTVLPVATTLTEQPSCAKRSYDSINVYDNNFS